MVGEGKEVLAVVVVRGIPEPAGLSLSDFEVEFGSSVHVAFCNGFLFDG